MFGKKDYDDFDDYKKEQEEIRNEKNSSKLRATKKKKTNRKVNPDGSIVYSGTGENVVLYFVVSIFVVLMILPVVINVLSGYTEDTGDMVVAAIFTMIIIMALVVSLVRRFFGNTSKIVTVTNDSVVIGTPRGKKVTYSVHDYTGMAIRRHYGKNHRYSSSSYEMIFRDVNDGEKKYRFCSTNPDIASDFNYEVFKRKTIVSDANIEVNDEAFAFPDGFKKMANTNKIVGIAIVSSLIAICLMAAITDFMSYGRATGDSFAFVMMFIVLMIVMVVFVTRTSRRLAFPGNISFISNSLIIDDMRFDASRIKSLVVTAPGTNDPANMKHSTLRVVTEEGEYLYCIGQFYNVTSFSSGGSRVPEWPYERFYNYIKNWAKFNNIDFKDYLI